MTRKKTRLPRTGWAENNFGIPRSNVWSLVLTPDKKVAAATDNGVYLYDDNPNYWNEVGQGLSSISIRAICYLADGTMLVGSSRNGIFRLAGNGQDWEQVGFTQTSVISLGVGWDGDLYAGTDNAIYRLGKGSDTWVAAGGWFTGGKVNEMFVVDSLQRIYAASAGGLFYTTDRGARWILSLGLNVTSTEISRPGVLYVGTSTGVMSSRDLGRSWTRPNDIALPTSPVNDIVVDSAGYLFAGTLNNGVFRSTDGGGFWNQTGLTSILMFRTVKALVIDGSGRVFAGTDTSGTFFSSDEGSNWYKLGSMKSAGITQFFIDSSGYFLAATGNDGVLFSRNGLDDWKPINDGLTDTCVNALVSDEDFIYAATESGVFKRSRTISAVVENPHLPRSFALKQNYPNPFNLTTTIEYGVESRQYVELTVYNVLGQKIAVLVNGERSRGDYRVNFDASRLASGVYFYRLETAGYSETNKMVLIR